MNRRQFLEGALAGGLAAMAPKLTASPSVAPTPIPRGPAPRLSAIKRVIVDTDPGNDDALAILMALGAPQLTVEAVTVCPGNLGPHYQQQVKNALFLVDLAGRGGRTPVFAGMSHPLMNRPYPIATFIHGHSGLGGFDAPEVAQKVENEHAVDAMRRIVNQSPGEVTILALGGLTNLAMAFLRDPGMARNLKGIVFVGGRYAFPGLPPSYNVLVDPEAAHVVFTSGVPTILVGADVINRDSILTDEDFAQIATFGTRRSEFFIASNDLRRTFEKAHRGTAGSTNPDSMAVAVVVNPQLALRYAPIHVRVELQGELTRGLLVYGDNIYTGEPAPAPNVDICLDASPEVFKSMVFELLAKS